jgi:hypothetical protein
MSGFDDVGPIQIRGTLEVDTVRGVIYFHPDPPLAARKPTLLRICNLPTPIQMSDPDLLDVTHMVGCSWGGKQQMDGYLGRDKKRDITVPRVEGPLLTDLGMGGP